MIILFSMHVGWEVHKHYKPQLAPLNTIRMYIMQNRVSSRNLTNDSWLNHYKVTTRPMIEISLPRLMSLILDSFLIQEYYSSMILQ